MVHIRSLLGGGPISEDKERIAEAFKKRGVSEVIWNITNECNLKCRHCYVDAGLERPSNELSKEEAIRLANEIGELGVPLLFLTGGEPFLRKDLFDVLSVIKDYDVKVVLSTGGHVLNREAIKKIAKYRIRYLAVPIYGPEEFHDIYVGVKGAFNKVVEAVEMAKKEGIEVCVKTLIAKETLRYARYVIEISKQLGSKIVYLCDLINVGRASRKYHERVERVEWRRLASYMLEEALSNEDMEFDIGAHPSLAPYIVKKLEEIGCNTDKVLKRLKTRSVCPVGRGLIAINASGDFLPCNFIQEFKVGNFRNMSLREAANVLSELGSRDKLKGKCGSCTYRDICGGCRAKAYVYYKDIMAEDPSCVMYRDEIR